MRCECRNAVREERQRIADYLDNRGQRWVADRIRNGEHLRAHPPIAPARGPEETRGEWEDGA